MPRVEGHEPLRSRRRFLTDLTAGAVALIAIGCSPSRSKSHAPQSAPSTEPLPPSDRFFGGRIDAGSFDDIRRAVAASDAPHYVPEARAYVSPFPAARTDDVWGVYPPGALPMLEQGVVVLYQRCTHLGCRVPFCDSSQWFECPCHTARFDRVGEQRAGPAPRGMDLMKASVVRGRLVIDTGTIWRGVPIGTNTTHQEPAGPFCVG